MNERFLIVALTLGVAAGVLVGWIWGPEAVAVGWVAFILSIGIGILYLPGSPAALVWPHEWLIFLGWALFGAVLLRFATNGNGG